MLKFVELTKSKAGVEGVGGGSRGGDGLDGGGGNAGGGGATTIGTLSLVATLTVVIACTATPRYEDKLTTGSFTSNDAAPSTELVVLAPSSSVAGIAIKTSTLTEPAVPTTNLR